MIIANRQNYAIQRIAGFNTGILARLQSHRALLLRIGMVCATLVIAPVVGVLVVIGGPIPAFIVVLVPLLLLGLNQIQSHFDLAPLIILLTAVFVPFSLPTGTQSRIVISLVVTSAFVGIRIFRALTEKRRLQLQPSPLNKPLLGFIVIVLISLPWSMAFRDPLVVVGKSVPIVQTASAVVMIMLPAAFLLVANYITDVRVLRAMVIVMLVAGAIAAIGRYSFGVAGVHDGGLFSMWVIGLATGLALFNRRMSWRKRGLLLVLAGSWVYWGFGLHISWLAGWLPGFIVLGILIFLRSKKLLLIALVPVAIYFSLHANYYLGTVFANEDKESGESRIMAWKVNWRVTGTHLLLGTGPGGYATYYMSYFPQDAMASHNNYVDIIAQTGILGLALCIWFFFALAWLGYKLCRRLRGRGDFTEALANVAFAGTVGCIVAMTLGDWLFPFAYTQTITAFDYEVYSWLFMGTILVLDRLHPDAKISA